MERLGAAMPMSVWIGRLSALNRVMQPLVWDELMEQWQGRARRASREELSAAQLAHATNSSTLTT